MSFKYPGIFLLVPLVVAGWRQWRRLAIGLVAAAVAFCATSPYFVVHLSSALGDALRVQRLARQGWLGFEHDHIAPIAFLDRLWDGLGPALLVCVLGLVVALVQRAPQRPDPRLVRDRLLPRPLHARRALRPLRAAARAGARRAGRADARARAGDAAAARRAADLDDPRRRAAHAHRHARWSPAAGSSVTCAPTRGSPSTRRCRRSAASAIVKLDLPLPSEDHPDRDRNLTRLRSRTSATWSSPARSPTACSPRARTTRSRPASTTACGS